MLSIVLLLTIALVKLKNLDNLHNIKLCDISSLIGEDLGIFAHLEEDLVFNGCQERRSNFLQKYRHQVITHARISKQLESVFVKVTLIKSTGTQKETKEEKKDIKIGRENLVKKRGPAEIKKRLRRVMDIYIQNTLYISMILSNNTILF